MTRVLFAFCALILGIAASTVLIGIPQPSSAQTTRQFTLYVREGRIPMTDGTEMYVWGFTDDPNGPAKIPGPPIVVNEGDAVEITLVNDLDPTASARLPDGEGHTIHLHGLDVSTEHDGVPETHQEGLVRQGGSYTYHFTATHAGTYFYHCHQNNVEHQQMGMYGPLVVRAANGAYTAYTGGPAFDRDYTLTLAEMGTEGHEQARRAAKEGAEPYNWLQYRPTFYLVNDRAIPAGQEVSTTLQATPGERVLARVINAGYVAERVHSHGQPFQIVATDGRAWPAGGTTDSLWLGPGEKYDLLFTAGANGPITIHQHTDEQVGSAPVITAPAPAAAESSTIRRYTLYARDGLRPMPDGATIPVYGFADSPEKPAAVPGPLLSANAGELVEVTLINDRDPTGTGHGFGVPALDGPISGPSVVRPGETGVYTFRVAQAGSLWYTDPSDPSLRRLGAYGALVVSPPDGSSAVFDDGPTFDKQYTMVLSEFDSAAHEQARQAGGVVAASAAYVPNYFLINGLSYPDTEADSASMVHAERGDRVLIRAINVGQMPHAMHLHGYHFILAARAGAVIPQPPLKDTVLILPGESYDLLFVADQEGLFPFHDHFETANTNNGVWLGGMHTMVVTGAYMSPSDMHQHDSPPPADGTVVSLRDNFYSPNQVTIPVGGTVRWQHEGRSEHTVTSLLGYFDSGTLRGGESFSFTFTAPGRYDYFCRFHITNRGVVIVQ